jgi:S-(hydroxymethyl)glutathione dehydrogenase / alcohol dehydrogenase
LQIEIVKIAVAKIRDDAPFKTSCYIGCGRGGQHRQGLGRRHRHRVRAWRDRLNVLQGARLTGAGKIFGVDINPDRKAWGTRFGMTHFVNPRSVNGDIVQHLVALTDGGADYTFDCTGNTAVMRQALEVFHRGWGPSIVIGVAEAGKEISTRPFQLVTGRNWRGTAFGGAKGRTDVPKIVDWYMNGSPRSTR